MTDRKPMSGNLPAEFAEAASDTSALHPVFQEITDIICPPVDDRDDSISRLDLIRELDRRIAFWQRQSNPHNAWFQGDVAKIATLRAIKEFVESMEAA